MDFEEIYIKYFNDVYKYVLSLCKNEITAEEITQEAFYKAMENIDKFDGRCKLYVWLCQIAKNTYFSYLKKQKKTVSQEDRFDDFIEFGFEDTVSDKETSKTLHKLLHNLKEPYKEVFSLRVFGELPFSQIGELFQKSDSWARLIFYRAKNEIRRNFDESDL